jgi:hypothetical protein
VDVAEVKVVLLEGKEVVVSIDLAYYWASLIQVGE